MAFEPLELVCGTCHQKFPSRFWFRAPALCTECFGSLSEEQQKEIAAANPAAPWEAEKTVAPIPEHLTFETGLAMPVWSFLGYGFGFWIFGITLAKEGWWLLWLGLAGWTFEFLRFSISFFRSPRRLEKRGNELHAFFRGGESKVWPLSGLSLRGRYWNLGNPWMVEVLDTSGAKLAEVWTIYLSNQDEFRRMIPLVKR